MNSLSRGGVVMTVAALCGTSGLAAAQSEGQSAQPAGLEEVVVTARRREESVRDVPISVAVFSARQMDTQGMRSVDDIARVAPGVSLTRNTTRGSDLGNSIAIRGVSSNGAGASTTGVYIDDTPVQVGTVLAAANFSDTAYPKLFDIQRVEVLRGPQGTLFGSGSEGGTVRFITPAPSLHESSAYVRSEIATTQYGAPSYEAGVAGGAPLIEGKLGFRASVWTRRDGGFIDWVDFYTGETRQENNNWGESTSARLALAWQATDNLMVTPSFYFQNVEANGASTLYLPSDGLTGTTSRGIRLPVFVQPYGNVGKGEYVDLHQVQQWGKQRLSLPALKVEYDFGKAQLISSTSYYVRKQSGQTDFGTFQGGVYAGLLYADPVWNSNPSVDHQSNRFVTQELRLQSTDPQARLRWVVGAYYSRTKTAIDRRISAPYVGEMLMRGPSRPTYLAGTPGARPCATNNECILAMWGILPVEGLYPYIQFASLDESQKAGFGQVDFSITDHWTATVGLRYSAMTTEFDNKFGGPTSRLPYPQFQHVESDSHATTPKYMLSYKTDGGSLFYASASMGFRPGGANAGAVSQRLDCIPALKALGLADVPQTYDPDSVWSYELGTKFALDQGRLQVDASVFQIDWDDQIRNISLTSCTQSFIGNVGSVRSRGFDLAVQWRALDSLVLSASGGYQKVEAMETINSGGVRNIITQGDHLTGSEPSANLAAQYSFSAWGLKSYARLDHSWAGAMDRKSSLFNPANTGYNPYTVFRNPETQLTNLRIGAQLGNWDVSMFVNNAFNEQPLYNKVRATLTTGAVPSGLLYAVTTRPRTAGVTATMRF